MPVKFGPAGNLTSWLPSLWFLDCLVCFLYYNDVGQLLEICVLCVSHLFVLLLWLE